MLVTKLRRKAWPRLLLGVFTVLSLALAGLTGLPGVPGLLGPVAAGAADWVDNSTGDNGATVNLTVSGLRSSAPDLYGYSGDRVTVTFSFKQPAGDLKPYSAHVKCESSGKEERFETGSVLGLSGTASVTFQLNGWYRYQCAGWAMPDGTGAWRFGRNVPEISTYPEPVAPRVISQLSGPSGDVTAGSTVTGMFEYRHHSPKPYTTPIVQWSVSPDPAVNGGSFVTSGPTQQWDGPVYKATAGFTFTPKAAGQTGTEYTVTARVVGGYNNDSTLTTTTRKVRVVPAAASTLSWELTNLTPTRGATVTATGISVKDQFGNTVSTGQGVVFSSSVSGDTVTGSQITLSQTVLGARTVTARYGSVSSSKTVTVFGVPVVGSVALGSLTANQPITTRTLTVNAYPAATTYACTGLPAGLTLNSSNQLSGTPTVAGSFAASCTPSNSTGQGAVFSITGTVVASTASRIEWQFSTLSPSRHSAVGLLNVAVKDDAGNVITLAANELVFSSDQADDDITGDVLMIGSVAGVHTITATFKRGSITRTETKTLTVTGAPTIDGGVVELGQLQAGQTLDKPLLFNAYPPVTSVTCTGLPDGLVVNGTTLTGTFTKVEEFTATCQAANGLPNTDTFTIHGETAPGVGAKLNLTASSTAAETGDLISLTHTVEDAYGNLLPATGYAILALTSDTSGDQVNTSQMTVTLGNTPGQHTISLIALPTSATTPLTETIVIDVAAKNEDQNKMPVVDLPSSAVQAVVGQPITVSVGVQFATEPLAVTSGPLPGGLTLSQVNDTVWRISGTPSEAGSFMINLQAVNTMGYTNRSFWLNVTAPVSQPSTTPTPGASPTSPGGSDPTPTQPGGGGSNPTQPGGSNSNNSSTNSTNSSNSGSNSSNSSNSGTGSIQPATVELLRSLTSRTQSLSWAAGLSSGVGARLLVPGNLIPKGWTAYYQWYRSNLKVTKFAGIAGATKASYKTRLADAGRTLKCVMTVNKPGEAPVTVTFTRKVPKLVSRLKLTPSVKQGRVKVKVTVKVKSVKRPTGLVKYKLGSSKWRTVKLKASKRGVATFSVPLPKTLTRLKVAYKGTSHIKAVSKKAKLTGLRSR